MLVLQIAKANFPCAAIISLNGPRNFATNTCSNSLVDCVWQLIVYAPRGSVMRLHALDYSTDTTMLEICASVVYLWSHTMDASWDEKICMSRRQVRDNCEELTGDMEVYQEVEWGAYRRNHKTNIQIRPTSVDDEHTSRCVMFKLQSCRASSSTHVKWQEETAIEIRNMPRHTWFETARTASLIGRWLIHADTFDLNVSGITTRPLSWRSS